MNRGTLATQCKVARNAATATAFTATRTVVCAVRIDDTDHPGGIQNVGKNLAVAAECKETDFCKGRAFIDLYDLSSWQESVWHIQRIEMSDGRASAVAITRLPSRRYLMFVMGNSMEVGRWFMSDITTLQSDTQWALIDEFDATRDVISDEDDWLRYCEEIKFSHTIRRLRAPSRNSWLRPDPIGQ